MRELDKVLDADEKVFWEGKPKFWPFFLSSFAASFFGLIFLVIGVFIVITGIRSGNWLFIFFPHFWVGLFLVFGGPIYRFLVYNQTYYAITSKRVIIQRGVIGRDFDMIDFDKIPNAQVNVGLLDKLFGGSSGSIILSPLGLFGFNPMQGRSAIPASYVLANVPDPYEVFKFFKKVSYDVKTDVEYPNKLRPKENPGYKTEYRLK